MIRATKLSVASAIALLAACANTNPIGSGETGGSGGGVWSTHGPGDTTGTGPSGAGKSGSTVTSGQGPGSTGVGGSQNDVCGDAVCAPTETCASCAADCGMCQGACGDSVCDPNETCTSCPGDCGGCSVCGDGTCDANETCQSCYQDCGVCACVADGFEPNNSSPVASPVASASDYCNLSICASDVDWIEFDVAHGFTATLTFAQGQGDLDLEIYSAQTINYVAGAYSHDDNETVTMSVPAGTYWARVYGYQGATNPSYCFRVDTN